MKTQKSAAAELSISAPFPMLSIKTGNARRRIAKDPTATWMVKGSVFIEFTEEFDSITNSEGPGD